jgi:hypothetical protein
VVEWLAGWLDGWMDGWMDALSSLSKFGLAYAVEIPCNFFGFRVLLFYRLTM